MSNNKTNFTCLYLPSVVFIVQRYVRPSKQLTQVIQIEHNIVKNPNQTEANQLLIYKRRWGFELEATDRETNPGSFQSGNRTRERWITNPTR